MDKEENFLPLTIPFVLRRRSFLRRLEHKHKIFVLLNASPPLLLKNSFLTYWIIRIFKKLFFPDILP